MESACVWCNIYLSLTVREVLNHITKQSGKLTNPLLALNIISFTIVIIYFDYSNNIF